MKIIVLDFNEYSAQLFSRGCLCRQYGPKTTNAAGEVIPVYQYNEKKREILGFADEASVVVEADIGPKKAKQWFLEMTLRHLEENNGPVWACFDKDSALSQICDEINDAVSADCESVATLAQKVKALNDMFKQVLKMEDPAN